MLIKKIKFLLLLIILSGSLSVFADNVKINNDFVDTHTSITDELLEHSNFAVSKPHVANKYVPIEDELLEPRSYNDSVFRLEALKENEFQEIHIDDELLMSSDFIKKATSSSITTIEKPDDYFIEKIAATKKIRKIGTKNKYDFSVKPVHISIKLAKNFNLKKQTLEGDEIPFEAIRDFIINGNLYPKGTTIIGRVETVSSSDKMGVPEDIKIDNFYIPDAKKNINLHGSIAKSGANRAMWVYPLYQAGNICFYVAGFVFVPIHGGRVKFSMDDIYTVFYEDENNLQNCYN